MGPPLSRDERAMPLQSEIERIREAIPAGQFVNEASVCTGIVLPILQQLGWPVFDPQVVCPEFSLEGRRVDYALCHPRGKPGVFVEVKQAGRSEGADRQLFEYAFHLGVPQAVLTDGQQWHFYLPAEQGNYQDRRVYKLDLIERPIVESVHRLERYLSYDGAKSGSSLTHSREDYHSVRRAREVASTIPVAWTKLVTEQDELLVDLLSDQVENLCGYKPEPDDVAAFLRTLSRPQTKPSGSGISKTEEVPLTRSPSRPSLPPTPTDEQARLVGFVLGEDRTDTRNSRDTLIGFFQTLARKDSSFLQRFAALPKHGRRRRYVARTREELYPGREDLAVSHSHELMPGWWIGTNYSTASIRKMMMMASEVAGLRFGRDVQIIEG
jgi:predicted type IV restriction endonuclease